MLQTIVLVVILFLLWTNRDSITVIIKRLVGITDSALGQVERVVEVSDKYIDGWSQDVDLSNEINRAKRNKELQDELNKINGELEKAGLEPIKPRGKMLKK